MYWFKMEEDIPEGCESLYTFCEDWVDYAAEDMSELTMDECKEVLSDLTDLKSREFRGYPDCKGAYETTPQEMLACVLEYIRDCIVHPRNVPRDMDDLEEEDLAIVNRVDKRLRELNA